MAAQRRPLQELFGLTCSNCTLAGLLSRDSVQISVLFPFLQCPTLAEDERAVSGAVNGCILHSDTPCFLPPTPTPSPSIIHQFLPLHISPPSSILSTLCLPHDLQQTQASTRMRVHAPLKPLHLPGPQPTQPLSFPSSLAPRCVLQSPCEIISPPAKARLDFPHFSGTNAQQKEKK